MVLVFFFTYLKQLSLRAREHILWASANSGTGSWYLDVAPHFKGTTQGLSTRNEFSEAVLNSWLTWGWRTIASASSVLASTVLYWFPLLPYRTEHQYPVQWICWQSWLSILASHSPYSQINYSCLDTCWSLCLGAQIKIHLLYPTQLL